MKSIFEKEANKYLINMVYNHASTFYAKVSITLLLLDLIQSLNDHFVSCFRQESGNLQKNVSKISHKLFYPPNTQNLPPSLLPSIQPSWPLVDTKNPKPIPASCN